VGNFSFVVCRIPATGTRSTYRVPAVAMIGWQVARYWPVDDGVGLEWG